MLNPYTSGFVSKKVFKKQSNALDVSVRKAPYEAPLALLDLHFRNNTTR